MIQRRVTSTGDVRYRVRVHWGGQIVATRTFSRKADAQSWESEQRRRLDRGQGVVDGAAGRKPVTYWCSEFLEAWGDGAPSTYIRLESLIRVHVLPRFGRIPISAVTRSEVRKWAGELVECRSPDTARQAVGALRNVLQYAVESEALAINVTKDIPIRGVRPGKVRSLTHEQVHSLAGAMTSARDKALVYLLAYCGLRFGEATALSWSDFNRSAMALSVHKAVRRAKHGREIGPTKTLSTRSVPVPSVVREAMLVFWAEVQEVERLSWWPAEARSDERLVFATRTGAPVSLQSIHKALETGCEKAGISPRVTPHQLRDTYASLAIASGASVAALAANLGHSMTMTLKHYAEVIPTERGDVALRLDQASADAAGMASRDDSHTTHVPD